MVIGSVFYANLYWTLLMIVLVESKQVILFLIQQQYHDVLAEGMRNQAIYLERRGRLELIESIRSSAHPWIKLHAFALTFSAYSLHQLWFRNVEDILRIKFFHHSVEILCTPDLSRQHLRVSYECISIVSGLLPVTQFTTTHYYIYKCESAKIMKYRKGNKEVWWYFTIDKHNRMNKNIIFTSCL